MVHHAPASDQPAPAAVPPAPAAHAPADQPAAGSEPHAPAADPRTPADQPSGARQPHPLAADPPAPADEPEAAGEPQLPTVDAPVPEPVEPPSGGVGPPRHLADRPGRARALVGVLVAVGVVVLLGVGALVVAGAGPQETDAATATTVPPSAVTSEATTTTTVPASPDAAFAGAATRLEAAGTFAYRGTVSASDVSAVRPSLWLAVDVTVEGEASLADARVHEVAVAANGRATETVVAGVDVWGRSAPTRDSLVDQSYEWIAELSRPEPATKGAANLVRWLAAVEEPLAAGLDAQGRRLYRGTLPASVLGPTERGRRAVDAEIVMTVDRAGAPVHVDIATAPGGPPLHLAFDLSALGAPEVIEPPAPH